MAVARRLYKLFAAEDRVIAALAVFLLIYYWVTPGIFQGKASGDGYFGFLYLPGLILHRSLDLKLTAAEWLPYFGLESTGRMANPCPIGPVAIWLPTYLIGLLLQKLHILAVAPMARFGQAAIDYFCAGLGALAFGQVGVAAMFRVLRRWLGVAAARFATVTAVLATPLCFYLVTQPLYQHACAFAASALFIEAWDKLRDEERAWSLPASIGLGALAGVAMLMRLQEAVLLLLPAVTLLKRLLAALHRREFIEAERIALRGFLVVLTAAIVFLPQLLLWKYFYGHLRTPQPPGHMRWREPALLETLFSMRAGLFPWVPVLYLALPGLLLSPLRRVRVAWIFALLFLIELWVNAAAWDYHGSWTFGPRRFTDATPLFAAGLGSIFVAVRERRQLYARLLIIIAVVLATYNGLLMELVRARRIKSSSVGAFPAAEWVRWAHGPRWLERSLDKLGYPFVQPVGWLYALAYRIPPSAFEGIVGNYFLERDWKVRSVFTGPTTLSLHAPSPYIFASGDSTSAVSQVRILLPLYTSEPLRLRLFAESPGLDAATADAVHLSWNGEPLPLVRSGQVYLTEASASIVHGRAHLNELVLSAPRGLLFDRLDLVSYVPWWR